jgi:hypothetical protein
MSRLRLVVFGHIEEPEPALVQHEYLWGKGQDAPIPHKTTQKEVGTSLRERRAKQRQSLKAAASPLLFMHIHSFQNPTGALKDCR